MTETIIQAIEQRIDEIESDERMQYDDADVMNNPILAMHQNRQKGRLQELRWMQQQIEEDNDSERCNDCNGTLADDGLCPHCFDYSKVKDD